MVKEMIDRLAEANEWDLLAISRLMGGLTFKKGPEREWFRKRFDMFQDILKESWVYQEIGQEFLEQGYEKGLEKGLKKGLEQGLELGREQEQQKRVQGLRLVLMGLVETHFPEITRQAQQHIDRGVPAGQQLKRAAGDERPAIAKGQIERGDVLAKELRVATR